MRRALLLTLLATACGAQEPRPLEAPTEARAVPPAAPPAAGGLSESSSRATAGDGGDPNAPTTPAADDEGVGGLGLSGVGEGDGGGGEGIGLGHFGGLGGRPDGGPAKVPRVRAGTVQVTGRLPQVVIQRIVRQNYGRFRLCYESGLRKNAKLQGRVQVTFVIDRNGDVDKAADAGSSLPDPRVIQCIVQGFNNLSFPKPEEGTVTVSYPVLLNPGD
jgi:hypothetical protein